MIGKFISIFNKFLVGSLFVLSSNNVYSARSNLTSTPNIGTDTATQQWNNALHSRSKKSNNTNVSANYNNCYSLAQRCAGPKCKSGCNDMSIAGSIVNGCIAGLSEECQEFSSQIVESLSAALVASSNSKQQTSQSSNNDEQLQQLQYQMQQMAEQQRQALAEANARTESAIASMTAQQQIQQTPVNSQSDPEPMDELRARANLSGQVFTKLEEVQTALAKTKKALSAFNTYAGCNSNGDNCKGPNRVLAMKNKAEDYLESYDESRRAIYNAMLSAQTAGVDISDVYRLLTDSCEQWGIYKVYTDNSKTDELVKLLQKQDEDYDDNLLDPNRYMTNLSCYDSKDKSKGCNFNMEVKCVTKSIAETNGLLKGLNVSGGNVLDVDTIRDIVNADYDEYGNDFKIKDMKKYCQGDTNTLKNFLKKKSNTLQSEFSKGSEAGNCTSKDMKQCKDINPNLAICSTHFYNIGAEKPDEEKKESILGGRVNSSILPGCGVIDCGELMASCAEPNSDSCQLYKTCCAVTITPNTNILVWKI